LTDSTNETAAELQKKKILKTDPIKKLNPAFGLKNNCVFHILLELF